MDVAKKIGFAINENKTKLMNVFRRDLNVISIKDQSFEVNP